MAQGINWLVAVGIAGLRELSVAFDPASNGDEIHQNSADSSDNN